MKMETGPRREIHVLHEIIRDVNTRFNQQEVLEVMLERLVKELGYRAATLRLLDREKQELNLMASYGLSQAYLEKGPVVVAKSELDHRVLAGELVALADLSQEAGFQYTQAAAQEGLASLLAVPLEVYDQVIGVLHLYTPELHQFSSEEKELILAIASLGSQAIQRSHLFSAFRKVARQVNSSLELQEVLTTLLVEMVTQLNVKAGSIRLLGPRRQTLHLAAAYGLSEAYLQKGSVQVAQSPVDQQVLLEGSPAAITDVSAESGFQYPEEARREGIRSVLVLPLQVKDVKVGVMRLYSGQVRKFSAEETSFAVAVSDIGAVAIENAKLLAALKLRLEELKQDADGWYRFLAFG
jgi:two-component system NtrC family sensor kinase